MERISFNGFNNNYATFKTSGTVKAGNAVSLNEEGYCVKSAEGDEVFGFCISVRGGYATVQLQGYYETYYSCDEMSYGLNDLICDGGDGVTISEDSKGTTVKVIKIDSDNSIVGFIF